VVQNAAAIALPPLQNASATALPGNLANQDRLSAQRSASPSLLWAQSVAAPEPPAPGRALAPLLRSPAKTSVGGLTPPLPGESKEVGSRGGGGGWGVGESAGAASGAQPSSLDPNKQIPVAKVEPPRGQCSPG